MSAAAERWMPVVGWEDRYEVSDAGAVRRTIGGQGTRVGAVLKPIFSPEGYSLYNLNRPGTRERVRAHRLILEAFVGPAPEAGSFGLHFDDDPTNNHVSNLRWGGRLDNAADRKRNGIGADNTNARKTHCLRGHEFSEENTWHKLNARSGRTHRVCRTCRAGRKAHRRLAAS